MTGTQTAEATPFGAGNIPVRPNRFASNVQTVPQDRRRVLGFAPGLRMSMNPRGSNLQGQMIPQGQLIVFNPRIDGFLKDRMKTVKNKFGESVLAFDGEMELSGRHFAQAVDAKFHGGTKDFGFRILESLNDLDYNAATGFDEADIYFEVLHPRLTCEMGLEEVTTGPAGDILNYGVPLPCPTCRLKWLNEQGWDAIQSAPEYLDKARLERLRQELLAAYSAGLNFARTSFDRSKGEVESTDANTKRSFDDADYHFMKMMHRKPSHIEQAEIQSEAARIQGEAIGKSVADAIRAQAEKDELERLRREVEELRAAKGVTAPETAPKASASPRGKKKGSAEGETEAETVESGGS